MTPETTKIDANTKIKTTYYDNGKVKSKITYANGKWHGAERWWWDNGKKDSLIMWRMGKKHGIRLAWYKNGAVARQEMRTNDKRQGMTTYWWKSGQKSKEIYYFHDKEYAHIKWNEEGNVIKTNFPTLPTNANAKSKKINGQKNR